jgi:magnesium-transporting ATPase (P-type)
MRGPSRARSLGPSILSIAHGASPTPVCTPLQVDVNIGLSDIEVLRRRGAFGRNALRERGGLNPLLLLLSHLFNTLTLVLFLALGASLAVQEWFESGVILLIILINAAVGFLQEYRCVARPAWLYSWVVHLIESEPNLGRIP